MKKISIIFSFLLIVFVDINQAQLVTDSWSFGFGFRYPRYVSANVQPLNSNYGGFISLQRNFSEHVGLRLRPSYSHFEGEFTDVTLTKITSSTNAIMGDLDFLYYFFPCEPVSPYLFVGAGAGLRTIKNNATKTLDENETVLAFNIGTGVEVGLDSDWKIMAEFGYHVTNNSEFDGAIGAGEINGRDSYFGLSLGLNYLFEKGEPSKYCQLYSGITQEYKDMTDYNKIESMIVKHIPKEVVKEVVVEKPAKATSMMEKWVLIGVNFDFNKSKLLPESYPILYDAAKTLLRNPDMKVEIQGYTDNIGSESYNIKLGQRRADVVKDYLVSKGIAANRINAISFGEGGPVADNKTADGRAMNRRIEFKVQ
ncbi:MAG: OmpA family protein [Ignavibacteriales bacterium]|nr:OmpA family protein [Ignavibacteriales bacterium]